MKAIKFLEENFIALYIAFLCCVGCLFLGHELNQIKHDAEARHNQKIINNCNMIIARGNFQ